MPDRPTPDRLDRARTLRREMTGAEKKLWQQLRAHRSGAHVRRQVPVGPYIADFLCRSHHLMIEVDGDQHGAGAQLASDRRRDHWFSDRGYRTLRFSNWQVMNEFESVILTIEAALDGALDLSTYAAAPATIGDIRALRDCGTATGPLSRNGGEMERGSSLPSLGNDAAAPSQPSPVPGEGSRAPGCAGGVRKGK